MVFLWLSTRISLLSLKRKASGGMEAAVKLFKAEWGTESEAPHVFESFAVSAACFQFPPLDVPG